MGNFCGQGSRYPDYYLAPKGRSIIHYFKSNGKEFQYLDIGELLQGKSIFETVILDVENFIPPGHRTILTKGGRIYLMGGGQSGYIFHSECYEYLFNEKKMRACAPLPAGKSLFGLVNVGNFI